MKSGLISLPLVPRRAVAAATLKVSILLGFKCSLVDEGGPLAAGAC